MTVTEVAATRDPGPPSDSWLVLQRLEDLNAQVKDLRQEMRDLRQEMKDLRREMRQELDTRFADFRREIDVRFTSMETRLDEVSRKETYRRDNRVVLLAILGTWVTLFGTMVGLFFRL